MKDMKLYIYIKCTKLTKIHEGKLTKKWRGGNTVEQMQIFASF